MILILNFRVLGKPMTSEVKSNLQNWYIPETDIFWMPSNIDQNNYLVVVVVVV